MKSAIPEPRHDAPSTYCGPAGFHWLIRGRLGGCPQPGLTGAIEEDLAALQRIGIRLLVTLTQEWTPPRRLLRRYGIASIHVPIPDMGVPTLAQADEVGRRVAWRLRRGQAVCLHCRGGKGRTGTLLAAQLIFGSVDSTNAILTVRQNTRGGSRPPPSCNSWTTTPLIDTQTPT